MNGQMSIGDWMPSAVPLQAGDTVEIGSPIIGRRLSWSEVLDTKMGSLILYKRVLQSYTYFKVVRPVNKLIKQIKWYTTNADGSYTEHLSDRVICEDGSRHNLLIDEWYVPELYDHKPPL